MSNLINQKIAVMLLGPLGDVINSSCVFELLKKAYPQAEISIITSERGTPAVCGIPEINSVYTLKLKNRGFRKVVDTLKFGWSLRGKFDTVVVLDNSLRAALCAFATLARRRIGRGRELRELFLTDIVPYLAEEKNMQIHVSEHYARVLKPLGCYEEGIETHFDFSSDDKKVVENLLRENGLDISDEIIGFCPACHLEEKSLKTETTVEIIKKINEIGKYKVAIIGGNDISSYVLELRKNQDIEFYDFSGKTTFTQTAALIDMCQKFISVDTSCMHLAFARKTPAIGVFFSNLATKWGPKNLKINKTYTNLKDKNVDVEFLMNELLSLSNKSEISIKK